jgi:hypothetical protein
VSELDPNNPPSAQQPAPLVDLNKTPAGHSFKLTVDRDETRGERSVRLGKEVALFVMAIVFVSLVIWLCVRTLLAAESSADDRKWAMSILTAATGGMIGYLVRR